MLYGNALIKHYLKEKPKKDIEDWCRQFAQSEWLEERKLMNMAKLISGKQSYLWKKSENETRFCYHKEKYHRLVYDISIGKKA